MARPGSLVAQSQAMFRRFCRGRCFQARVPHCLSRSPSRWRRSRPPVHPPVPLLVLLLDGRRFAYEQDGAVGLYDIGSKTRRVLISLATLSAAATPVPARQAFDWQNRGVREQTIQWFPGGDTLLIRAGGDLFQFRISRGGLDPAHGHARERARSQAFPRWRASGVSTRPRSVHARDRHAKSTASPRRQRYAAEWRAGLGLSRRTGSEHGVLVVAGFQAHRLPAIRYCPRVCLSSWIALTGLRAVAEPERYPQAGTSNADVHVGVVPARGGPTRWMDLGEPRGFLSRAYTGRPIPRSSPSSG